ncbi:unnamed protein product [Rotaria sp. Silwood2]|nr:unnamed protein product [Rotaria sp. Silwood2]
MIHSLFDALGYIIQVDTSTTESLILLELKRRSMSTLDYLLNDKNLVEIFIEKPYASIIAKLSMHDSLFKNHSLPVDLRLFNQKHLEQYCLSLDTCVRSNEIIETKNSSSNDETTQDTIIMQNPDDTPFTIWNHDEFNQNLLIVNALSISALKYNGWKPYTSKSEIEPFENGRIGDKEISIVSLPRGLNLTTGRIAGIFPTVIVDDLQLTEGFTTGCSNDCGVGDDKYSWSYDGSRGILYNDDRFQFPSEEIRWKEGDICGCGIEIDGTLFEHQANIETSTTKCNMLPYEHSTVYFPAVSLQVSWLSLSHIELVISPEDMAQCPLPNGYKPLLVPKLIDIENSIVPYPYRAYSVCYDDIQNYVHKRRSTNSMNVLCDLINEHHLDTSCILDDGQLLLTEDSSGFPLSIDNQQTSS